MPRNDEQNSIYDRLMASLKALGFQVAVTSGDGSPYNPEIFYHHDIGLRLGLSWHDSDIDLGPSIETVPITGPEATKNAPGQWLAQVLGNPDGDSWEISVVRESNTHGRASWGWFDENKLLVSHNGGPCHWPLAPGLGDKMVEIANAYAKQLNNDATNRAYSSQPGAAEDELAIMRSRTKQARTTQDKPSGPKITKKVYECWQEPLEGSNTETWSLTADEWRDVEAAVQWVRDKMDDAVGDTIPEFTFHQVRFEPNADVDTLWEAIGHIAAEVRYQDEGMYDEDCPVFTKYVIVRSCTGRK